MAKKKNPKPGTVAVKGTLELSQFWPHLGQAKSAFDSDADTIKVKVDPKAGFTFDGKPTLVFDDAGFWHKDKKKKLVFDPVVTKAGIVTIRLQGVDAPEMHYFGYKQKMGESCTVALKAFLTPHASKGVLDCHVFSRNISEPNDVFDVYGRLVGDIAIRLKGGGWKSVNEWLLENGYAFPSFYESMDEHEIKSLRALAAKSEKSRKNVWKFSTKLVAAMDRTLKHKKNDPYDGPSDRKKPVLNPKLFRRLYTFEIKDKKVFGVPAFRAALNKGATKNKDQYFQTDAFLVKQKKAAKHKLGELVGTTGKVTLPPAGIVFTETPTRLKDSKHNDVKAPF